MDYFSGWCRSQRRLDGMSAIVTGCNTGIGKETARDFYKRGARVIMACRNIENAEKAKQEIEKETPPYEAKGSLVVEKLDISSLESVREFVKTILETENSTNILVNNAGIMCVPQGKTVDGFETHIGTNHFGHALLTLLLLPKLISSGTSRIVTVSSMLHTSDNVVFDDINFEKTPYDATRAYSRSKCANVLFSRALALKLNERGINNVTTYSLHPGVIRTDLGRHFSKTLWYGASWAFRYVMGLFIKSPRCGAQTSIYCAVDDACANDSGLYYKDCAPAKPSQFCQNDDTALQFWDITIEKLHLQDYHPWKTDLQ